MKNHSYSGVNIWIKIYIIMLSLIATIFFGVALFSEKYPYFLPFVGITGIWKYHVIHIGSLTLNLYWTNMLLCVVIGAICFVRRRSMVKLNVAQAILTNLLLYLISYIGAKLMYTFESWETVQREGFTFGGVSLFGTVFIIPLVFSWFGPLFKIKPLAYLDFVAPVGIFCLSVVRFNCFISGCCGGITVKLIGRAVIPVQVIECILDVIILAVLLRLEYEHRYDGGRFFLLMGAYGFVRFFLEFLRTNERLGNSIFTRSQIFALISFSVGLIYYLNNNPKAIKNKHKKKHK